MKLKVLILYSVLCLQIQSSSPLDKFFINPCKVLLNRYDFYGVDMHKTVHKKVTSVDGTLRNDLYAAYKHSPELRLQRAADIEEASRHLAYGLGGTLAISAMARMFFITSDHYLNRATATACELSSVAFVLMLGKNYFDSNFKNDLDYRIRVAKHNNDKDAIFDLAWKKLEN